jgi:hypothetical protein
MLAALLVTIVLALSWRTGADFLEHSWHCFRAGVVLSLPAAALAVILLRRGRILSRAAAGALAGLWAGLIGFVTLHFGCAMNAAPHAVLGHWAVPLAGVLVGYGVGRWMPGFWLSSRKTTSWPSQAEG